MTRADAAQTRRKNLALIGYETAEGAIVLVVDPADAAFAERTALLWSSHWWLILVVVIVVTARRGSEIFLGLRRSTDFVLVQRHEIANDAVVELECALVLGERRRLGSEFGDDVIAVVFRADGVGELSTSPMGDFRLCGCMEQSVEAVDFVCDGGVFESRVEDVHRLVCARHSAILLLVVICPPLVAGVGGRFDGRNPRPL